MAAKPINYKKWDHIEISDDEDDTHPNVDTPSLYRWRHQARVERMEQAKKEKEEFQAKAQMTVAKYDTTKKQIATLEAKKQSGLSEAEDSELKKLQEEFEKLNREKKRIEDEKRELEKKERLTPLNIDTICKEGKSRTIVNPAVKKKEVLTDEERVARLKKFAEENMPLIKKFGMLQKFEDSQRFLMENQQLVCEETASQLCLWAIDLEVEEKHALMEHVAHQAVVMNFIMELAKHLDRDPHSCVVPFFNRMSIVDKEREYIDAFRDELSSFKQRVRERAKVRIEEALRHYEEEERAKRIAASPGGVDPQEVFESLPEAMKACFESRDISLLQQTVAQMDPHEAKFHIDRCIKSGLWVPGGGEHGDSAADGQEASANQDNEDSSDYEDVDQADADADNDNDKKPSESADKKPAESAD